ncbi:MAG: phosphodiesterase [Chloroflexota bacterium]|nr:MAG: phosphodiesterase [Chloroflexota bacterium]
MSSLIDHNAVNAPYKKVVVIGWDGADWRLLRPWVLEGKLPTLARFVQEGSYGYLRSTMRPESSVAWASFSTGVNPGKHSVYGFVARTDAHSYAMSLTNASSVRATRFWEVLGERYHIGLLNVPYTYPPAPVNGFLIGGMLTPSIDSEFTFPPTLKEELLKKFHSYITDVTGPSDDKARLIENVRVFTGQQQAVALHLLKWKKWDFFSAVFVGPDRLQHFLWEDTKRGDSPLSDVDPKFQNELLAHYQTLDLGLAQILLHIPEDALVFLISDHGFNGCARKFFVNRWLRQQGLLSIKSTKNFWSNSLAIANYLHKVSLIRKIKQKLKLDAVKLSQIQSTSFTNMIDWSRTFAYFGLDGGVRINMREREPEGIVSPGLEYEELRQSLRQQLTSLVDPLTHKPVFAAVYFREELYHGPFVELAPDLILDPMREQQNTEENFLLDGSLNGDSEVVFGSSYPYSGNHAHNGIFCALGPGVRRAHEVTGAEIIDVAPTILAAMGCAIPDDVDGKLLDIFVNPMQSQIYRDVAASPPKPQYIYSPEEEELVQQRLQDLGYL